MIIHYSDVLDVHSIILSRQRIVNLQSPSLAHFYVFTFALNAYKIALQ